MRSLAALREQLLGAMQKEMAARGAAQESARSYLLPLYQQLPAPTS